MTKGNTATPSPSPQAKPNYVLIAIGIVLGLVPCGIRVVLHSQIEPMSHALFIAVSLTFILYGLYPVGVIKGIFGGVIGKVSVAGPAALGLFVFIFVWNGLMEASERDFIVLQDVTDYELNSFQSAGGTTVSLVAVDSLSNKRLEDVLNGLRTETRDVFGELPKEMAPELRNIFEQIVEFLKFGRYKQEALELFDSWTKGQPVDANWADIVSKAAALEGNTGNFTKRVKRTPFALLKVTDPEGKAELILILPGYRLRFENEDRDFAVPIIANPSLSTVKKIHEAVVLQPKPRDPMQPNKAISTNSQSLRLNSEVE